VKLLPLVLTAAAGLISALEGHLVAEEPLLDVQVVNTFENLEWPDWITGIESGLYHDPRPVVITGARDGTNRMFFATQYGAIFVTKNDPAAREPKLFLDIRARVIPFKPRENEEGFLGLAFHPRFEENGEFFVYYTAKPTAKHPHQSVISRFRVSDDDPNRADPQSEEVLLRIEEPYWNHNGGTLVFGPDGYLYVGLGDGGLGGDPNGNGQNLGTLLGSILRIDVDHKDPGLEYSIPPDNPFVDRPGARGEIWACGIRNVWRVTFDRTKDTCWAADVGQNTWEEIDIVKRGGNYGWNAREGLHAYKDQATEKFRQGPNYVRAAGPLIEPVLEYHHDVGKSITGGYVYRGKRVPALEGAYLYADYVTGQIWALWYDEANGNVIANRTIRPNGMAVLTFGEDDEGEVYFTSEREVFTLAPKPHNAGRK
jgi:glucose/arabinose dehydrogenase